MAYTSVWESVRVKLRSPSAQRISILALLKDSSCYFSARGQTRANISECSCRIDTRLADLNQETGRESLSMAEATTLAMLIKRELQLTCGPTCAFYATGSLSLLYLIIFPKGSSASPISACSLHSIFQGTKKSVGHSDAPMNTRQGPITLDRCAQSAPCYPHDTAPTFEHRIHGSPDTL